MKRAALLSALCLIVLLCLVAPAAAAQNGNGISVTCDNGVSFNNGVEIIVNQMRAGFTYTATAIGINGFDPVLAVLDANGRGLCTDDDATAAAYGAQLPSTGFVPPSQFASQIRFSQTSGQNMADVSIVVGGFGNVSGEFLLILEGMAVTDADGAGDPFSVHLTPGVIASGIPVTTYMISVTNALDPLMFLGDENLNVIEISGEQVYCDDGGDTSRCWGDSSSMTGAFVSRTQGRQLGGFGFDSMLSLPTQTGMEDLFFNLVMTSYNQSSFGEYLVAFHIGVGTPGQGGGNPQTQATPVPQQQQQQNTGGPSGISVTCDNGVSFNNGVEIIVNQMRAGFTYTATAIGINGFDPVLAVLDANGRGLCTDDDATAAAYGAQLPSTGFVPPSQFASQIRFSQTSGQNMADVSIVVGGFGNVSGEFLLILEGMAVTDADGAGDPFSVHLTPGVIASGIPVTAYMISVTNALDPLMFLGDENLNVIEINGEQVYCDDGGDTSRCWGDSSNMTGAFVSRTQGRQLGGFGFDSMLSLPTQTGMEDLFFNLVMTSYNQSSFGDYLIAFHIGIGSVSSNNGGGGQGGNPNA